MAAVSGPGAAIRSDSCLIDVIIIAHVMVIIGAAGYQMSVWNNWIDR